MGTGGAGKCAVAFVVGEALPEAGAVGFAFLDGDFEGGDAVL